MIVMQFPKPEPRDIHLRNEMCIPFFLLFFGKKGGEYHSRKRDLMRLMSERILKAKELLQEGYVLLEQDEVWTRREKDDDGYNDGKQRGLLKCWVTTAFIKIRRYSISAH